MFKSVKMWQHFLDTQSWTSTGDNTQKAGGKCRSWEPRFRWVYDNGTMNDIMWNLRRNWNWRTRWKNSGSKLIRMVLSLTSILLEIWLRSRLYMMMMTCTWDRVHTHDHLGILACTLQLPPLRIVIKFDINLINNDIMKIVIKMIIINMVWIGDHHHHDNLSWDISMLAATCKPLVWQWITCWMGAAWRRFTLWYLS